VLLIILMLTFVSGSTYLKGESSVTVDNISFGELLMGEALSKEDLQDRVVGIEFWGINCGPCKNMMPHLVNWHKKYKDQGFVLLGFHRQDPAKAEILAFCKSVKVPFPIYQGGNVSGIDFSKIPHFTLFDHTGKMIFDGHPADAEAKVADAIKNAPDWLTGEGPYKKLKALAEKIQQRKDVGQDLKTLKEKHLNSEDAEEKAEAEKLVARLTRYGNKLLQKAEAKKDKEALNSYNLYQEVSKMFKGDEIGDNADKILAGLKEDKTFQDNMKADKELADMMPDIEKLKGCNKCGSFNKECDVCKKKNAPLEILLPKAKGIVKKYPDSPAAARVKELLPIE